jgi:hypothetical protein
LNEPVLIVPGVETFLTVVGIKVFRPGLEFLLGRGIAHKKGEAHDTDAIDPRAR